MKCTVWGMQSVPLYGDRWKLKVIILKCIEISITHCVAPATNSVVGQVCFKTNKPAGNKDQICGYQRRGID